MTATSLPPGVAAAGDVFVAIDQGGQSTRAFAFDDRGQCLAQASMPVDTLHGKDETVEHDGEALIAGLGQALGRLGAQIPFQRWRAVGLAVQRSTIACWERDSGALLAPVISWQDRRQAGWVERLARDAGRVQQLTGLPLSPHYGACKLRWCLDHVEAVRLAGLEQRLCAGPLASLLLFRLADDGRCRVDEANAARTQLWSLEQRAWSEELCQLFGVPRPLLPRLQPTRSDFGHLRLGGTQVPMCVCSGDQSVVPFAAGPLDGRAVYVNLGTGAFALRPLPSLQRAAPLLTSVLDSGADGIQFALEGTVNGAGSALDWWARTAALALQPLLQEADAIDDELADVPLFLNGIAGIGSPYWAPAFRSRFLGKGTAIGQLCAVLESIVFLLQLNLDAIERTAGQPVRIIASGGLAGSDYLLHSLASLSGLPVERLDACEATARGLGFLVAGRPAGWQPPAVSSFDPQPRPLLQARFRRWREALRAALAG